MIVADPAAGKLMGKVLFEGEAVIEGELEAAGGLTIFGDIGLTFAVRGVVAAPVMDVHHVPANRVILGRGIHHGE